MYSHMYFIVVQSELQSQVVLKRAVIRITQPSPANPNQSPQIEHPQASQTNDRSSISYKYFCCYRWICPSYVDW